MKISTITLKENSGNIYPLMNAIKYKRAIFLTESTLYSKNWLFLLIEGTIIVVNDVENLQAVKQFLSECDFKYRPVSKTHKIIAPKPKMVILIKIIH